MYLKKCITFCFLLLFSLISYAKENTLKFGDFLPATTVTNRVIIPTFIEKVAELSDGQLKVKHYPGGILGSGGKIQLDLIEKAVLDIAEVVTPYTPGRVRGLDVLELPYLFSNELEGAKIAQYLGDQGLVKGLDKFKVLGYQEVGPYIIHSAKKIEKLDDIRGLKFRVVGAAQSEIIRRLGGIPVSNITAPQIAENLHRGVIDGALMDMGNVYNFKMNDVTKYHVVNLYLGGNAIVFPMTKKKFSQLSKKSQQALEQVSQGWFTELIGKETLKQSQEAYAKMKAEGGHHFVMLSPRDLEKAEIILQAYQDEWRIKTSENHKLYDAVMNYKKTQQ
ncbi:MAG: TRAP transporter substrate-binding protein DctP [Alphaproteobacteria bacterium]